MKPHRNPSRVLPPEEPKTPFPLTELILVALFVALMVALWRVAP